ncbi:MAG: ABC transporter ATP-binding protein [Bacilli bacterium]|nr:ABC transporter ATP-binding protein [Bacilli bacterium]MBR4672252.1 ABC transporter ATP-binding protein [Bacilli bacterium]
MELLEINHLTKKYGSFKALDDVNLKIAKGKIIGLLGMNGAGKTTLLKLINELLIPTSGEILFKGKKLGIESKNDIAYLSDKEYLDENMNAVQILKFYNDFYKNFNYKKALKYLDEFDIEKNKKIYKMSKGMKDKLKLVLVISRSASLYIIDEPLTAIDPITREYILDIVFKKIDKNSSLIVTTHLLNEMEKVFDEIIVLDKGKVVLNKEVKDLKTSIKSILRRYSNVLETV